MASRLNQSVLQRTDTCKKEVYSLPSTAMQYMPLLPTVQFKYRGLVGKCCGAYRDPELLQGPRVPCGRHVLDSNKHSSKTEYGGHAKQTCRRHGELERIDADPIEQAQAAIGAAVIAA